MALGQYLTQTSLRDDAVSSSPVRPSTSSSPQSLSKNINRLISAAVVSPRFRGLLLTDPAAALAAGYNGETFHLTPAEYAAITSLRVATLRDFAVQLLDRLQAAAGETAHLEPKSFGEFRYVRVAS